MTQNTDIEKRLEALEVKASFAEDALDQFDQIITRQQATLDALLLQVRSLREQLGRAADATGPRNLRDELPPHY